MFVYLFVVNLVSIIVDVITLYIAYSVVQRKIGTDSIPQEGQQEDCVKFHPSYENKRFSLIYIYKQELFSACLFFIHLDTVQPNRMKFFREYPFVYRKVIEQFWTQNFHLGDVCPLHCWIYYCKCLFQRVCVRLLLNSSRMNVYENLLFLPLETRYSTMLKTRQDV